MTPDERGAAVAHEWGRSKRPEEQRHLGAIVADAVRVAEREAAEHARRGIKQACLFAVEAVKAPELNPDLGEGMEAWARACQRSYAAGVRAAADAVAQVEVE